MSKRTFKITTTRIPSGLWSATMELPGRGGGNQFGHTEQEAIRNAVLAFLPTATDLGYFDDSEPSEEGA